MSGLNVNKIMFRSKTRKIYHEEHKGHKERKGMDEENRISYSSAKNLICFLRDLGALCGKYPSSKPDCSSRSGTMADPNIRREPPRHDEHHVNAKYALMPLFLSGVPGVVVVHFPRHRSSHPPLVPISAVAKIRSSTRIANSVPLENLRGYA
jgi:hypothetical protein